MRSIRSERCQDAAGMHEAGASSSATATSPIAAHPSSPRTAPRLLAGGILAGPVFLVTALIEGVTRAGFSFARDAISLLSLGSLGWIQDLNFMVTGLLAALCAVRIRRTPARRPRRHLGTAAGRRVRGRHGRGRRLPPRPQRRIPARNAT